MDSYVWTRSGTRFHIFKPDPAEVDLGDIAHALSNLCRFTGHTSSFYSVAEHSCLVHDLLRIWHPDRTSLAIQGLMHDAAEAYIGDISSPLKSRLLADFSYSDGHPRSISFVERGIRIAINRKHPGTYPSNADDAMEIKAADEHMLGLEIGQLMRPGGGEGGLKCWDPATAKSEFLGRLEGHGLLVQVQ